MRATQQTVSLEALDSLAEVDTLCLFVGEDERPLQGTAGYLDWRLCGGLSRLLQSGFFTGTAGESLLLPTDGRVAPQRVFALGIGKSDGLTSSGLVEILGRAVDVLGKAKVSTVALEIPGGQNLDEAERTAALEQVFLVKFTGERVIVLVDRQQNGTTPPAAEKRPR